MPATITETLLGRIARPLGVAGAMALLLAACGSSNGSSSSSSAAATSSASTTESSSSSSSSTTSSGGAATGDACALLQGAEVQAATGAALNASENSQVENALPSSAQFKAIAGPDAKVSACSWLPAAGMAALATGGSVVLVYEYENINSSAMDAAVAEIKSKNTVTQLPGIGDAAYAFNEDTGTTAIKGGAVIARKGSNAVAIAVIGPNVTQDAQVGLLKAAVDRI